MLATTAPVRSKTGLATQHKCGSSSSRSTAYPRSRTWARWRLSLSRSVIVRPVLASRRGAGIARVDLVGAQAGEQRLAHRTAVRRRALAHPGAHPDGLRPSTTSTVTASASSRTARCPSRPGCGRGRAGTAGRPGVHLLRRRPARRASQACQTGGTARAPRSARVPGHGQGGCESGGRGPVQAQLLRHLPDADLGPVALEHVEDLKPVEKGADNSLRPVGRHARQRTIRPACRPARYPIVMPTASVAPGPGYPSAVQNAAALPTAYRPARGEPSPASTMPSVSVTGPPLVPMVPARTSTAY